MRDRHLEPEIERTWKENFEVYGAPKVRRQMKREGFVVARYTVERLMRKLGPRGLTDNVKNALCSTFHAVRTKHVPCYRAEFENRFNHRFWLAAIYRTTALCYFPNITDAISLSKDGLGLWVIKTTFELSS